MKERELLMRSVVNLMFAVGGRVLRLEQVVSGICSERGHRVLLYEGLRKLMVTLELLLKFKERQEDLH
jgi:hypothetical protein